MDDVMTQLERALDPRLAAIAAGVGGVGGGAIYLNLSGIVLGIILVLGLSCFVVAIVSLIGVLTGASAQVSSAGLAAAGAPVTASYNQSAPVAPTTVHAVSNVQADTNAVGGGGSSKATTPPASSPVGQSTASPPEIEQTQSEAELLSSGRFAEYHLAKAKRLYAAGSFREAATQAAASAAHGDPGEAVALRKAARDAIGSK